eukprot:gene10140-12435_t
MKSIIKILLLITILSQIVHGATPNYSALVDKNTMTEWVQKLNNWGSRIPGSKEHKDSVDWIANEFSKLKMEVKRDEISLHYWDVKHSGAKLEVKVGDQQPVSLSIASVYPFSGVASDPITAEMVFVNATTFKEAAGKIAVFKVPYTPLPTNMIFANQTVYPSSFQYPAAISNPVLSATLTGPKLKDFKEAGVLGCICLWQGMDAGTASGQWLPFTLPLQDLPAVWLSQEVTKDLESYIQQGAKATLEIKGSIVPNTKVETVWAVLEGKNNKENIIINTHSDGPNPIEENGFLGMLSVAQNYVRNGIKPNFNLIFVVVAGHLRLPDIVTGEHQQATSVWLNKHPELWNGEDGNQKAVAGVVFEHMGSMEWNTVNGIYQPTGNPELEVIYATSQTMRDVVATAMKGRTVTHKSAVVDPTKLIMLGEGEPLHQNHIPAVAFLGAPNYLLAEMIEGSKGIRPDKAMDLSNIDLLLDQTKFLSQVIFEIEDKFSPSSVAFSSDYPTCMFCNFASYQAEQIIQNQHLSDPNQIAVQVINQCSIISDPKVVTFCRSVVQPIAVQVATQLLNGTPESNVCSTIGINC